MPSKEDLLKRAQPIFDALWDNFPDPAESTRVLVFCLLRESMMGSGNLSAADALTAISKELNRQIPAFEKQDIAAINAAIFPDP